jgi:hypothetical protein
MLNRILMTALTATLAVGMSYASGTDAKVTIPVNRTSAFDGKQMYTSYCAPCHGTEGKGQGPVASALKATPTDLTVLSRSNNGKYPSLHVMSVIENGVVIKAHGTPEMPVWGPVLAKMSPVTSQDKQLRISNLNRYVETMQVK